MAVMRGDRGRERERERGVKPHFSYIKYTVVILKYKIYITGYRILPK